MKRSVGSSRWVIGYTKDKIGITDGGYNNYASALMSFGSIIMPQTFTTSPTTEYIKWYDTNSTDLEEQVMIVKGNYDASTMPPYEPYIGNSYPLYLGVENLFDYSTNILANANIDNVNNIIKSDNTCKISYVKCQPNTTYTISRRSPMTNRFVVATTNSLPSINTPILSVLSKNDNTTTSITITTPSNANYIVVRFIYNLSDDYETYAKTIQIEKGSKVNSYSEYGVPPIELCKIGTYQDYIYKDNGVWYLHKEIGKYICTASDNWNTMSYGTNSWRLYNVITFNPIDNETLIMTTKFKGIPKNDRNTDASVIYVDGSNVFAIRNTPYTTKELAQSGMNGEPIYYVLANSTNTLIEDTTLIEQLEALSS